MHDIVPRKKGMYTSITINIVSQKKKNSHPLSHVFPNTYVCMCVYGGSFVHAHINRQKIQFLCTNMFAKYEMHPKTYSDMLNKRK